MYAAGVQIAAVLPIIFMALNKAIVPYYYQGLKEGTLNVAKIKRYTLYTMPFGIIPALIGYFLPEYFYLWFLSEDYGSSKYYAVMYLIGYGANLPYLMLVNYFFYNGHNLIISKMTLASAIVYLILLYFFSLFGIEYIPFSLIFSNLILILIMWRFLKDEN